MPTYDYRCQGCGHEFEQFQSMTAASLRKCPQCKTNKLKRLIGIGAGVIFKGSGFYETDYRSDSYKTAAKADKDGGSSSASSGSGDSAKSESKAESKTESKAEGKSDSGKSDKAAAASTPAPAAAKAESKSPSKAGSGKAGKSEKN